MYWNLIRPLLFLMSAEKAHDLTFEVMERLQRSRWLRRCFTQMNRSSDPILRSQSMGLAFDSPIGLAAGLDKNARLLPWWPALGFGFVEMGTLTPLAQPGNPSPRLFRLVNDRAIINRMGFNNQGAEPVRERMLEYLAGGVWPSFPVGINMGKGKPTPLERAVGDYETLLDRFLDLGDYFVVNVSSPNTPGLRELQEKSRLKEILAACLQKIQTRFPSSPRPLLLKVAPDLEWSALDEVIELCLQLKVAGVIATNTTLSREGLKRDPGESGGLSGVPLKKRSSDMIRHIYRQTKGRLPIIGVGGIFNAEDAYEKIRAGASLVQVYTGLIYEGPGMVSRINRELALKLKADGLNSIRDAVGVDVQ